ncbi:amino acid permease [bacterium]|nr:amino acid permease [bacterium]
MPVSKITKMLFGPPRNPMDRRARHSMTLVALMAWIGLGADGLSSACYGPEEAFVALGNHTSLAIYLALATMLTVGIISLAYTQVIELFPNGGGGYRAATSLLGNGVGLISGSALVVDYVLTIAISVASATDALFSMMPFGWHGAKMPMELAAIVVLAWLNLRGAKESIAVLMPIFLSFVVTHAILILVGVFAHREGLGNLVSDAVTDTQGLSQEMGWMVVVALFLKAFSLGGGTYTGLEAVSNNVQNLAEPRVTSGKWTMALVACSLAFMAAGIIMLYLLWDVNKVHGETLNATVFKRIMDGWEIAGVQIDGALLSIVLICEAGLLLVASNTGFLAGPQVLASMATDRWMPHFFSSLSSRLVVKNGIVLMGLAAMGAIVITGGAVHVLVVLYSINVFLTFSLALAGLCVHWIRSKDAPQRFLRLGIAGTGFAVCATIFVVTLVEKFSHGGWITIGITSSVIIVGWLIHRHYMRVYEGILDREVEYALPEHDELAPAPKVNRQARTAAVLVSECSSTGVYAFRQIQRMFPGTFKNFVFISVGEVGSTHVNEEDNLSTMQKSARGTLKRYEDFCHRQGIPAVSYLGYGTDLVDKLTNLTNRVSREFPNVVYFGTKLVFDNENPLTQILHNQTAYILQRRLNVRGESMLILPMKV